MNTYTCVKDAYTSTNRDHFVVLDSEDGFVCVGCAREMTGDAS